MTQIRSYFLALAWLPAVLSFGVACEPSAASCVTDAQCASGSECSGAVCVAVALCATQLECADGLTCNAGKCRAACGDETQCSPLGLTCAAGLCQPVASGGGTLNSDAVGSLMAGAGAPGAAPPSGGCVTSSDCGPSQTCVGGVCGTADSVAPVASGGQPGVASVGGAGSAPVATAMAGGAGDAAVTTTEPIASPSAPSPVIDDFEDGDGNILPNEGRVGQWYAFNDGLGQMSPAAGDAFAPEAGGANGTALAIHVVGSNFTDWGAAIAVDFNNQQAVPSSSTRGVFDASAYTGVSFWAKGTGAIRIKFRGKSTTGAAENGTCVPSGDLGCGDDFGVDLSLTADWTQFHVAWADATQQNWGVPATLSPAELFGLAFQHTDVTSGFDFWVDELSFYSGEDVPMTPDNMDMMPVDMPMTIEPSASAPGMCKDLGGYPNGNGSVTFYTLSMGSSEVNCSFPISGSETIEGISTGGGRYFGAMNTQDYNTAAACGACVEVTRDGSRKVTVTIVDQCPIGSNPKCRGGHIDLSKDAYLQIGSEGEGYLGTGNGGAQGSISWSYVECPVMGDIAFRLKEPSNSNWNQIVVSGHRYPITKLEVNINGTWVGATRLEYNYWEPPDGKMGTAPYQVRVTDVTGATVTGVVPLASGAQSAPQFPVCQ